MRRWIGVCMVASLLLLFPMQLFAQKQVGPTVGQLTSVMKQVNEQILLKNGPKAIEKLNTLKQLLLSFDYKPVTTFKGMQVLFNAVDELQQALVAIKIDQVRWKQAGEKLYFAIDALAHHAQPLWHQVEQNMLLQFNTMMKAAATKNGLQLRLATHSFIKDFEQIRPAAIIQSKTGDLTEFDAFITFLKKQVAIRPLPFQSFSQISVDGTRLLWLIFHPQLASATVSTTWMVPVQAHWYAGAISLGGIIATILAYVGYRKYRMV